jgi:hypothetical protein
MSPLFFTSATHVEFEFPSVGLVTGDRPQFERTHFSQMNSQAGRNRHPLLADPRQGCFQWRQFFDVVTRFLDERPDLIAASCG